MTKNVSSKFMFIEAVKKEFVNLIYTFYSTVLR